MNLEKLTIGQMAKLNGISEQTLRLYDREQLLTPMVTDPRTGYRYYHIIQSARLDMIQNMKAYGMTLRQISSFFNEGNADSIKEFLLHQQYHIDCQIDELIKRKRSIARTLDNFRQYEALPKDGQMFLQYIPERWIYRYTSEKDFFDQDYAGYEYMLRELKMHLDNNELSMTYFCNVGSIVRQEDIKDGRFTSHDVFMFVDSDDESIPVQSIPAAMYYCTCAADFYAEKDKALMLIDEIHSRGFEICGDYICEVIVELPIFKQDQRNMFYKIEIPVVSK